MIILANIDTKLFHNDILSNLINNLTELTCSTLANIIAIDYVIRLNSKPQASQYIKNCITKLKAYLDSKVINDDNFSVALTLFAVAIAPENVDRPDKNNLLEQSQDIIVENLINIYFKDITINSEEKEKIRMSFKELLKEKNFKDIINQINSDPKLFSSSIMYAIKKYNTYKEISSYIKQEIDKVQNISLKFTKNHNKFKQMTGKIAGAVCALTVGAISVATAGATFAIVVIPAAVFAIKYAPEIGEKIGEFILSNDKAVKLKKTEINIFKEQLQNNNQGFLIKEKEEKKKQQKYTDIRTSISPTLINAIKDDFTMNKKKDQKQR